MAKRPLQSVFQDFEQFLTRHQTVMLATLNESGLADASYAPFIQINDQFYIYISELAQHTHNLLARPQLSLLFIEDEHSADNIFARKRITIKAEARTLTRETAEWSKVMDIYTARLGETALVLRGLPDFHLFEINPLQATFVRGFAQAYELTGQDLRDVRHRNERGHGQSNRQADD